MRYELSFNVSLNPINDKGEPYYMGSGLMWTRRFQLSGDSFAELAAKIDRVDDVIKTLADE